MLDDIQHTVNQHEGLGDLLHSITGEDDQPDLTIGHIKTNLGFKRDYDEDIKEATEAYNIAVCRVLGREMQEKLPRELRDMVYSHLIPEKLTLWVK